jgi:hypothetical protein
MPGVKRWLFNIAAGVSLLVCMVTAVLWVRSYWIVDSLQHSDRRRYAEMVSLYGTVSLQTSSLPQLPTTLDVSIQWLHESAGADYRVMRSFYFAHDGYTATVAVPHWFMLMLALLLPIAWTIKFRRRHRPGQCRICGYDLRATPDRCPECGAIPAADL